MQKMNSRKLINNTKFFAFYALKYAPIPSIVILLLRILSGVVPIIQTLTLAEFMNTILNSKNSENWDLNQCILLLCIFILCITLSHCLEPIINFVKIKMTGKLILTYRYECVQKCASFDYKHIDSSDTWDFISRVLSAPEERLCNGYQDILSLFSLLIQIFGVWFIVMKHSWQAGIGIAICSIPLYLLSIKSGKATYQIRRDTTKDQRSYEYISRILLSKEAAEERLLFGYGNECNKRYLDKFNKVWKIRTMSILEWGIKSCFGGLFLTAIAVFSIISLLLSVISGQLTIGLFMSLCNSMIALIRTLSRHMVGLLNRITENAMYMEDYNEFMKLSSKKEYLNQPLQNREKLQRIEFKDVTFCYPGTEVRVLNHCSFLIEEGKHYAFVGANGSGKTTITKLLLGLYDNYEGDILLNGSSLRTMDAARIKSMIGICYQDFARYQLSLYDNVQIGNIININNQSMNKRVNEVLEEFDLNELIKELPNKEKTMLGKIYEDGVDVSGGQWQRIALARAILSQAELLVLDEPTASLDPISESKLYENFMKMKGYHTILMISHRLGSVKLANCIMVLKNGTIVEKGTHEELMDKKGIYYTMYESQKGGYVG